MLALMFSLSSPVSAQIAGSRLALEPAAASNRSDTESARSKTSDLVIATRDAIGKLGEALPLEIKLVRVRNVYVEAVKLLGLPEASRSATPTIRSPR
ncbi:hypothetical protein ACRAWG_08445 [Methylobacterium sp. P31]